MEEKYLTPRQRKWLDESRRIGPGPFTPSDRKLLEGLYADMSPEEQEELADYIQDTFMKPDPITLREKKPQKEPSPRLRELLATGQGTRRPPVS
jgi:hypothetical protein